MIDEQFVDLNVRKAQELAVCLSKWGCRDEEQHGRLTADLSDLYAAAGRYQQILDALLTTLPQDTERLSDLLADLGVELQHIQQHAMSAVPEVEALAEQLDA